MTPNDEALAKGAHARMFDDAIGAAERTLRTFGAAADDPRSLHFAVVCALVDALATWCEGAANAGIEFEAADGRVMSADHGAPFLAELIEARFARMRAGR